MQSQPAIVARAFIESMWITMGSNMKGGYPGYYREIANLSHFHYRNDWPEVSQLYGTQYEYLLRLDRTSVGWHAIACTWNNALVVKQGNTYRGTGRGRGAFEIQGSSVDMRQPATPGNPPDDGRGPARYPSTDVFGAWTVPKAELVADPSETAACQSLKDNPVPPEYRSTTPRTFDHPLPALPPIPGWPKPST